MLTPQRYDSDLTRREHRWSSGRLSTPQRYDSDENLEAVIAFYCDFQHLQRDDLDLFSLYAPICEHILSTPQRYDSDTAILLICRPGPCHFKHHKGTIQTFTGGVVA